VTERKFGEYSYDDKGLAWVHGCKCGHDHIGRRGEFGEYIGIPSIVCTGPCGLHEIQPREGDK
jgi:hypothetical protein